jgi:hypothetical protein
MFWLPATAISATAVVFTPTATACDPSNRTTILEIAWVAREHAEPDEGYATDPTDALPPKPCHA